MNFKLLSLLSLLLFGAAAQAQTEVNWTPTTNLGGKENWTLLLNKSLEANRKHKYAGAWEQSIMFFELQAVNPASGLEALKSHIATQNEDGTFKDGNNLPLWVLAVEDYVKNHGNRKVSEPFFAPLLRQIDWMEKNCKAGEGYKFPGEEGKYYPESGSGASVEATSMAYLLYNHAAMWSIRIGSDPKDYAAKAKAVQTYINTRLWKDNLNAYTDEGSNTVTAETIWPMALFASTPPKARAICDTYILKTNWFLTKHPLPLEKGDAAVENTYTYFAARGAWMFGRHNACLTLISESLNDAAAVANNQNAIYRWYAAKGGNPSNLKNKGTANEKGYAGTNPIWAMIFWYDFVLKNKI